MATIGLLATTLFLSIATVAVFCTGWQLGSKLVGNDKTDKE